MTGPYVLAAKIIAALALLAGLAWGYSAWTGHIEARGFAAGAASVQLKWDRERGYQQARQIDDINLARAKEAGREQAKDKEIRDAIATATAARTRADRADHAAGELRDQLATLTAGARAASRAPANPGAGGTSPAAADTIDLLAVVLGEMESAGRQLATEADARGAAGGTCSRSYDSLSL